VANEKLGGVGLMRSMAQFAYAFRSKLASVAGLTYDGKRDLYKTLGYQRQIQPIDYRSRYRRNEIANRIVTAAPQSTWRGGCDIVEDADLDTNTPFEQAVIDFDRQVGMWDKLYRADKLSRIGRYSALVIGAPGDPETPLESVSGPQDIAYIAPFDENDARILLYETDKFSPRFGLPVFYTINRTSFGIGVQNAAVIARKFHWTRVQHIAEGLLDDNLFGEPALECVWNRLDDLEKVVGAGGEATWRSADKGMQFDIDPTQDLDSDAQALVQQQVDNYEHNMSRFLTTRGVKIHELGSDAVDISKTGQFIISLISAGTGIPQRVLMGSEQGKLAAKQDRAAWDNRITDRQNDYAGPCILKPFLNRMIALGALPTPDVDYEVVWSSIRTMDDEQRAMIATEWAGLNKGAGAPIIVMPDEIRERILGLPPLAEVDETLAAQNDVVLKTPAADPNEASAVGPTDGTASGSGEPTVAAGKRGAHQWKHIHQAADRFRAGSKARRLQSLRRRTLAPAEKQAADGGADRW
jgi:hypothetical protein